MEEKVNSTHLIMVCSIIQLEVDQRLKLKKPTIQLAQDAVHGDLGVFVQYQGGRGRLAVRAGELFSGDTVLSLTQDERNALHALPAGPDGGHEIVAETA